MASEVYKGRRLTAKPERRTGRTASYVNGVLLGYAYGTTEAIVGRELSTLRSWVDMADERRVTEPDAYPVHFYQGVEF